MTNEMKMNELNQVAGGKPQNGLYYTTVPSGWVPYLIQRGDTLSQLACDHRTTVEEIMKFNPLIDNKNLIIVGCALLLPNN